MLSATQGIRLSPEQDAIVHHNNGEGSLLVVAAAGSGKTRILTERTRYLLTEKAGNFSVLCLTFTNKAAEEMGERLKDVPGVRDRTFIGTLHAFALEILKSRRHELGYQNMPHIIERENDRKKILEQVFLENPILKKYYTDKDTKDKLNLLDKYLSVISDAKRNLTIIDENTPDFQDWSVERLTLYTSYNRILKEQNLVDFDDLLLLSWRILNENPAIANLYRRLYKYILVDEAQDLNYAQYNFLKALCGNTHRNVFMVGDPRQSIHGYTGADKKFMLNAFPKDFDAEKCEIHQNYRSSQKVIEFATRLASNGTNNNAYYKGIAEIHSHENEEAEAAWVISKIKELVSLKEHEEIEGDITLDKMAILARNRYVFLPLLKRMEQDEFLSNNFSIKKSTEALDMETRIMKLFDLGTRILCNPANQVHFHQILSLLQIEKYQENITNNGLGRLSKLLNFLPENQYFANEFRTIYTAWEKLDPQHPKMNEAINLLKEYLEQQPLPDEEKILLNYDLEDYATTWKKFLQASSGNLSLTAFRQFAAMGSNSQRSNQKGLTLATIHMMKGLEFDIVFVMGMNEGTFPDYRAKDERQLEEEKNNAYVAFTRAKRWLFITYPLEKLTFYGNIKRQNKSRFI